MIEKRNIPISLPVTGEEEWQAVKEPLMTGWITSGPKAVSYTHLRVAGEVTSPLNVRYDKSYSFKDYIHQSGGFLARAKRGQSYVQYPNGVRKGVKRFLWFKKYPKVEPGSTIVVSRKPKRGKTSIQEVLAIASSLTTLVFLVDRLRN